MAWHEVEKDGHRQLLDDQEYEEWQDRKSSCLEWIIVIIVGIVLICIFG